MANSVLGNEVMSCAAAAPTRPMCCDVSGGGIKVSRTIAFAIADHERQDGYKEGKNILGEVVCCSALRAIWPSPALPSFTSV